MDVCNEDSRRGSAQSTKELDEKAGGAGGPSFETVLNFRVAAPLRFLEGAEGLVFSLE